jgi:hypothetical protein
MIKAESLDVIMEETTQHSSEEISPTHQHLLKEDDKIIIADDQVINLEVMKSLVE